MKMYAEHRPTELPNSPENMILNTSGAWVMPTLNVRGVPDDLYDRLRALANQRQRPLSALVVALLQRALETETQQRQAELLETIQLRRFKPPTGTPDDVKLLREDREH